VVDGPRIDELRRRVLDDPASLVFLQLADEYRRAGRLDEAIAACRDGLAHHPDDASLRVILGLSLMESGRLEESRRALEGVVRAAPASPSGLRDPGPPPDGRDVRRSNPADVPAGRAAALVRRLEEFLAAIQRSRAGSPS
jgi:hypothetical protein